MRWVKQHRGKASRWKALGLLQEQQGSWSCWNRPSEGQAAGDAVSEAGGQVT